MRPICATLFLSLIGCSNGSPLSGKASIAKIPGGSQQVTSEPVETPDSDPSRAQSAAPPMDDTDKVSAPVPITGVYLQCVSLLSATDTNFLSSVGCRTVNDAKVRVPLTAIADSAQYSYITPNPVDVSLSMRQPIIGEEEFDSIFEARGLDKVSTQVASQNTRILVKLNGLIVGGGTADKSSLIRDAIEASALVDASEGGWSRRCSHGECEYIDTVTGISWSSDLGNQHTYTEAKILCDSLVSMEHSDWHLATASQLATAHSNNINSEAILNGEIGVKIGTYWSNEELPDNLITVHDFWPSDVGTATLTRPKELLGSAICNR